MPQLGKCDQSSASAGILVGRAALWLLCGDDGAAGLTGWVEWLQGVGKCQGAWAYSKGKSPSCGYLGCFAVVASRAVGGCAGLLKQSSVGGHGVGVGQRLAGRWLCWRPRQLVAPVVAGSDCSSESLWCPLAAVRCAATGVASMGGPSSWSCLLQAPRSWAETGRESWESLPLPVRQQSPSLLG